MTTPLEHRPFDAWIALMVTFATCSVLLGTLDDPGMAWDEGFTIEREEKVREWFRQLLWPRAAAGRRVLFERNNIDQHWPFARWEPDGHPPFYALIGLAGWAVAHGWLPTLEAYRLGPAVLFAATAGSLYLFVARRGSRLAGLTAAGSLVLMPRVFAHAHFASYDVPIACLWLFAAMAFWKATEAAGRGWWPGLYWSAVFAGTLALAAATKFTGWLVPMPLLAWSAWQVVTARHPRPKDVTSSREAGSGTAGDEPVTSRVVETIGRARWIAPAAALLPLVIAAPDLLRSIRELNRIDREVRSQKPENLLAVPRTVAGVFRAQGSSRLPGWALIGAGPLIAAAMLYRMRLRANSAGGQPFGLPEIWTVAIGLTPTITLALNPPWWHDPLQGIGVFLWSNLSRGSSTWIPTRFFGVTYDFALPWYNSLAWVALTVPPGILVLVLIGVLAVLGASIVRRGATPRKSRVSGNSRHRACPGGSPASAPLEPGQSPQELSSAQATEPPGQARWRQPDRRTPGLPLSLAWLAVLNGATLLVIRALPSAPGHDGERQLLASFPFLACLAGHGVDVLAAIAARIVGVASARWLARGVATAVLVWAAIGVWRYHPRQLAYYSELIGGVRGAERLGLEPTYYWDALTDDVLDWLRRQTGPGEKVAFSSMQQSFVYLRLWNKLPACLPLEPGVVKWYVMQNRPGLFRARPQDGWLAEHGRPAATWEQDGVPLIWVFPASEYEKAFRETRTGSH